MLIQVIERQFYLLVFVFWQKLLDDIGKDLLVAFSIVNDGVAQVLVSGCHVVQIDQQRYGLAFGKTLQLLGIAERLATFGCVRIEIREKLFDGTLLLQNNRSDV
jgi:hypothetical protein